MRLFVYIAIILFSLQSISKSEEISEEKAFREANIYKLTGSLISSNIYLTYMSIDMLFINANNYTNEEKQVICHSIKNGLERTKQDFSSINSFVEYESKDKFEKHVEKLYNSLLNDIKLLEQYFEDNEVTSRSKFLENHKKIWKLLSNNMEEKTDEKD